MRKSLTLALSACGDFEPAYAVYARDAYAHQHGYCAGLELIALTYHRERGLRSRQVVEIL